MFNKAEELLSDPEDCTDAYEAGESYLMIKIVTKLLKKAESDGSDNPKLLTEIERYMHMTLTIK